MLKRKSREGEIGLALIIVIIVAAIAIAIIIVLAILIIKKLAGTVVIITTKCLKVFLI
jgi:hypothetical protein